MNTAHQSSTSGTIGLAGTARRKRIEREYEGQLEKVTGRFDGALRKFRGEMRRLEIDAAELEVEGIYLELLSYVLVEFVEHLQSHGAQFVDGKFPGRPPRPTCVARRRSRARKAT